MSSSNTIRGSLRILSKRPSSLRSSLHSRKYATPASVTEEIDPQLNGYPQLPLVSRQYLPATGWWDNQMRRNFGDTVSWECSIYSFIILTTSPQLHEQEELVSMWGPDIPVIPPPIALFQFTLVTFGFITFGFLVKGALIPDRSAVPRVYPFSGLVTELGGADENKVSSDTPTSMPWIPLRSCL